MIDNNVKEKLREFYLNIAIEALNKEIRGMALIGGPVAIEQINLRRQTITYLRTYLK